MEKLKIHGSEKQLQWANDILIPVQERIARFPDEIRVRHEQSLAAVEFASTVIECRHEIAAWCERVDEWLNTQTFQTAVVLNPAGFGQPSVIRSVIF